MAKKVLYKKIPNNVNQLHGVINNFIDVNAKMYYKYLDSKANRTIYIKFNKHYQVLGASDNWSKTLVWSNIPNHRKYNLNDAKFEIFDKYSNWYKMDLVINLTDVEIPRGELVKFRWEC